MLKQDQKFMRVALQQAKEAQKIGEVPVGAVLVQNGKIIARGYNKNIKNNDPSAHAEIIVLRKAGANLKNHRLIDCTLYATIEPCPMCAGALVNARIGKVVFGAFDNKTGACKSVFNIVNNKKLNHRVKIKTGVLEKECSNIIKNFFKDKRRIKHGQ